jgi:hypothetical protein
LLDKLEAVAGRETRERFRATLAERCRLAARGIRPFLRRI